MNQFILHRCISKEKYSTFLQNKINFIEIYENDDYFQDYSILEFPNFIIGVKSQIGGNIYPKIFSSSFDHIYIAVDSTLTLVSTKLEQIIWSLKLDTPFSHLICLSQSSIIVIEEAGVGRYRNFKEIWYVATNIITDYHLHNNILSISQMDLGQINISIETGDKL